MLNIFFWIVLIFPWLLFHTTNNSFYLSDFEVIFIVMAVCMEFYTFFGLPGAKTLSNLNQITCKFPSLAKAVAENEDKIRKIRFISFVLIAIVDFIIITLTKWTGIILCSYAIFLICINLDIVYALASADDRKLFWQQLKTEYINIRSLAAIAAIIACFLYIFKK